MQLQEALEAVCDAIVREDSEAKLVKQTVFLRDPEQVDACRAMIDAFFEAKGNPAPVTTYVTQPPCGGEAVVIQAYGLSPSGATVEVQRKSDHLAIVRQGELSWIHCGHVAPEVSEENVYDRSQDAFARMKNYLSEAGVPLERVVRTWLYLGDIVGPEGQTQRYKELNRARSDYYREVHFGTGLHLHGPHRKRIYPASTGIGSQGRDLLISCVALEAKPDRVSLISLENPQQTSAFDYAPVYSKKSPKFARAMAVVLEDEALVYVSGTASITESESRHDGDVRAQTHQTLDNIGALISQENFAQHDQPEIGATLDDLAEVCVYVKRIEDHEAVREICEARLPGVPAVYVEADVCRPELLVEIEGIALAHK